MVTTKNINRCQVLSLINGTSGVTAYLMTIQYQKGKIAVTQQQSFTDASPAGLKVDKSLPVIIVMEGNGILSKIVQASGNMASAEIIVQAFPSATPDHFYAMSYPAGKQTQLCLVRRAWADEWINGLREKGILVLDLHLGPYILHHILPLFHTKELHTQLYLFQHEIDISDVEKPIWKRREPDQPDDPHYDHDPLKVGIKSYLLPALAAGIFTLSGNLSESNVMLPDYLISSRQELVYKNRISRFLLPVLIALFVMLMLNFFAFSHFSDKHSRLQTLFDLNESKLVELDSLDNEVRSKQAIVEQLGLSKPAPLSFYADQLAMEVPVSIRLTEMNICPRDASSESEHAIVFEPHSIIVGGICAGPGVLNGWVQKVEKYSWIQRTEFIEVVTDESSGDQRFVMKILF